jgi:hypothetical protein
MPNSGAKRLNDRGVIVCTVFNRVRVRTSVKPATDLRLETTELEFIDHQSNKHNGRQQPVRKDTALCQHNLTLNNLSSFI